MHNKKGNLYGILFLVLMLVTVLGIFTSERPATGLAVRSNTCFEGTDFGECSDVKPKYCDNGAFKNDCGRCGCGADEVCQEDGSCLPKCEDGTVFSHCSENKPLLCSKGALLENCFKCGCFPGQTCSNDGTCSGDIEVGAGAEEEVVKEEIVATCSDETIYGDCSLQKPNYCDNGNLVDNCELCGCYEGESCSDGICLKKTQQEAGFWWNLFCKVFYYNEYDDCIGDAIRYQNK